MEWFSPKAGYRLSLLLSLFFPLPSTRRQSLFTGYFGYVN
jgi:hypothetical protein